MTAELLRSWVSGLDDLFSRVAGRFGRVEPRRQARGYVMGLLAPVERKNGWQLAEAAGDCCPDRMQRLLNNARRDPRVCALTCGNMYSTPDDKGELELAYYLCYGPAETTIEQLVGVAGARWAIEECFQSAKNEAGLDQYQVRRYDGWHRHITLAMLAHAYLAVTAANAPKAGAAWSPSPPPRPAVSWHT